MSTVLKSVVVTTILSDVVSTLPSLESSISLIQLNFFKGRKCGTWAEIRVILVSWSNLAIRNKFFQGLFKSELNFDLRN